MIMSKIRNYLGRNFKRNRGEDRVSPRNRSLIMSKIRSKETKLETSFIVWIKKKTKRKFITNVSSIRGRPDIVFPGAKVCIFIDSDFWHGWQYPRWKHLLKNNFWREKIEKNRQRDRRVTSFLRRNNWKVIRIWEHEIKNNENDLKNILNEIQQYL